LRSLNKVGGKEIDKVNSKINNDGVEIFKGVVLNGNLEKVMLRNLVINESDINLEVMALGSMSAKINLRKILEK